MKYMPTGVFATIEQLQKVTAAFDIDYRSPIMAVGPGHTVITATEDFRDMAKRFAIEAGLPDALYAIEPNTREFHRIDDVPTGDK